MDKAQIKQTVAIILSLVTCFALFGLLVTSFSVSHISNQVTDENVSFTGENISIQCNATPTRNWNITKVELWENMTGAWRINQTVVIGAVTNQSSQQNFSLNISNRGDHSGFDWFCNFTSKPRFDSPRTESFTNNNSDYQTLWAYPFNDSELTIEANEVVRGTNLSGAGTLLVAGADYVISRTLGNISINMTNLSAIHGGWNITFNVTPLSAVKYTENRSVHVEFPPVITRNEPASRFNSSASNVEFNLTVNASPSGVSPNVVCSIFTNESQPTANFSARESFIFGARGGPNVSTYSYGFRNDGSYNVNVRCHEQENSNVFAYAGANITISVDTSAPIIAINSPLNNTYNTSTIVVQYTANDTNLRNCSIFHDFSGTYGLNRTNTSELTSGTQSDFTYTSLTDRRGNLFRIDCWDHMGNYKSTGNYTITIDGSAPTIRANSFINNNSCNKVTLNATSDEEVNMSFRYTIINGDIANVVNRSSFENASGKAEVTVSARQWVSWNVTMCDRSGNCNASQGAGPFRVNFTDPVCSGFSLYGIADGRITLGLIANQSGADYVLVWNASTTTQNSSGQGWITHQKGTASKSDQAVGKYVADLTPAVLLQMSLNSTWDRNISGQTNTTYKYNLSQFNNFIMIPLNYSFANFTASFLNVSGGTYIGGGSTSANLTPIRYSCYNNTNQGWYDHFRGFKYNNATAIQSFDVCWVLGHNRTATNATWEGRNMFPR